MKHGGSISHHHGVGKLRKKFLPRSIGNTGVEILKGLKNSIDPNNIFATGNLIGWSIKLIVNMYYSQSYQAIFLTVVYKSAIM